MKILYATDNTNYLVHGKIYLSSRIFQIMRRYAYVFEDIILYARFIETETPPEDAVCATFVCNYIQVGDLKKCLLKKDAILNDAIKSCSLVIGRVPSLPAYKSLDYARRNNIPTFTESMGCAWDAYWNHSFLGKIIAPYMFFKMKRLVSHADYASYVTAEFLQKRYPSCKESLAASNVFIKDIDGAVLDARLKRVANHEPNVLTLMTTAAVNVKYKGQEYVIKAIPALKEKGIKIRYYIVGDGDQTYLRNVARKNNVESEVVFTGRKSLQEVFNLLDHTDVYLQPSLQEGLPRSVIEAMSRACIVVGANTAGIPELIDKHFVVRRKSSDDIVRILLEINSYSYNQYIRIVKHNFDKAKEFQEDVLNDRKFKYYQKIKTHLSSRNKEVFL